MSAAEVQQISRADDIDFAIQKRLLYRWPDTGPRSEMHDDFISVFFKNAFQPFDIENVALQQFKIIITGGDQNVLPFDFRIVIVIKIIQAIYGVAA